MSSENLRTQSTHKKARTEKTTWFEPVVRRIKAYVKDQYKSFMEDYQEATHNRVYCSFYVEEGGKSKKILVVGKKLHPTFDVYNNPK